MDDLISFVQNLQKNSPGIRIPDIGEEPFKSPERGIMDSHIVLISFDIPIVRNKTLHLWSLMSSPDEHSNLFVLSNKRYFQKIIVDNNSVTYTDVTNMDLSSRLITQNLTYTELDRCTESVILNLQSHDMCRQQVDTCQNLEHIYQIDQDNAFVVTCCQSDTNLLCGTDKTVILPKASMVEFSNCGLININQSVWTNQKGYIS